MFEILVLILFCWLFGGFIRLAFRVTWGFAKVAAVILSAVALPVLILGLLMAGGILLLIPVGLVAVAFWILSACS